MIGQDVELVKVMIVFLDLRSKKLYDSQNFWSVPCLTNERLFSNQLLFLGERNTFIHIKNISDLAHCNPPGKSIWKSHCLQIGISWDNVSSNDKKKNKFQCISPETTQPFLA